MPQVGEVVTCVGVAQGSAFGIEDSVEAGDEHVGRDTDSQRFVDALKNLPRRGGHRGLSGELQHAASGGHHKRCRYTLACCVTHDHSQPTLRKKVEVVEISSYLPGGPVV